MRSLPLIVLLFLLCPPAYALEIVGSVVVIDGDSLQVGRREVRLHGIDAPEFDQTCDRQGAIWKCGQRAIAALAGKIGRQAVRCDVIERDKYNRHIATCFLGTINLNQWLVREGWAMAYQRYSKRYVSDEDHARQAQKNIWSGKLSTPETWRYKSRFSF